MCNKMSDVRLSNASPTLRRMDARQPDTVRAPVRRNLFGRPDPEEIRNCVNASIEEDVRRFKDTYNYDPVADTPLASGNYEWQADRNAPEFYSRPPHRSEPPRGDDELPGCVSSTRSDTEERSERQPEQQDGSRKRHSGSCPCECQSKRSHTDEDDDDDDDGDEDHSAGSQAGEAAEEEEEEEEEESAGQQ